MKISVTTEKEVNPMDHPFRKGICHAYAILDEERCLQVCHGLIDKPYITVTHAELAFSNEETQDCSREEFLELFDETQDRIDLALDSILELQPA